MCISGLVCLLNWKLCWVSCRVSMTHHSWSWLESRTRLSWLLRSLESGLLLDRQKRTSSLYQMRFISSQSRWESYSSSGPGTTPGALLSCHLLALLLQVGRHSLHTCDLVTYTPDNSSLSLRRHGRNPVSQSLCCFQLCAAGFCHVRLYQTQNVFCIYNRSNKAITHTGNVLLYITSSSFKCR